MNIPSRYRAIVYGITFVLAAFITVANALGLIPADAVSRGVDTGLQVLTLISAALALRNVTPD